MSITRFTTRNEAIESIIIASIEGTGEVADAGSEYDLDAIADKVLSSDALGYFQTVDTDEFWNVVESHQADADT